MSETKGLPVLGEIRKGEEIGRKSWSKYIWHACPDCGRESWVAIPRGQLVSQRCKSCAAKGKGGNNWKGGRIVTGGGYIGIWLSPDDFFYSMQPKSGYVLEHRLVVARALGRCLHPWELIHHKHDKYPAGSIEDKQDNRYPENLQIVSDYGHKGITILENRIKHLEQRVTLLEAENIILRQENKERIDGE